MSERPFSTRKEEPTNPRRRPSAESVRTGIFHTQRESERRRAANQEDATRIGELQQAIHHPEDTKNFAAREKKAADMADRVMKEWIKRGTESDPALVKKLDAALDAEIMAGISPEAQTGIQQARFRIDQLKHAKDERAWTVSERNEARQLTNAVRSMEDFKKREKDLLRAWHEAHAETDDLEAQIKKITGKTPYDLDEKRTTSGFLGRVGGLVKGAFGSSLVRERMNQWRAKLAAWNKLGEEVHAFGGQPNKMLDIILKYGAPIHGWEKRQALTEKKRAGEDENYYESLTIEPAKQSEKARQIAERFKRGEFKRRPVPSAEEDITHELPRLIVKEPPPTKKVSRTIDITNELPDLLVSESALRGPQDAEIERRFGPKPAKRRPETPQEKEKIRLQKKMRPISEEWERLERETPNVKRSAQEVAEEWKRLADETPDVIEKEKRRKEDRELMERAMKNMAAGRKGKAA